MQTFNFTLTAQFALPAGQPGRSARQRSGAGGAGAADGEERLGAAMAISFKESPWYIQALVFVALAILLLAAGEYMPGLPVARPATDLAAAARDQDTEAESGSKRLCRSTSGATPNSAGDERAQQATGYAQGHRSRRKGSRRFYPLAARRGGGLGVQIRQLTAQAVVSRDYHYEMPFEIEVDGPYFSIVDFFSRLSRLSRIINVGDLNLRPGRGKTQYPVRPNTTVTGTCIVTTFFTMRPRTQRCNRRHGAQPHGRRSTNQVRTGR